MKAEATITGAVGKRPDEGADVIARLGGDEFVMLLPETHQISGKYCRPAPAMRIAPE